MKNKNPKAKPQAQKAVRCSAWLDRFVWLDFDELVDGKIMKVTLLCSLPNRQQKRIGNQVVGHVERGDMSIPASSVSFLPRLSLEQLVEMRGEQLQRRSSLHQADRHKVLRDNLRPQIQKSRKYSYRSNAKLTDDEERAKDFRIGTVGWPRSSSFGPASG